MTHKQIWYHRAEGAARRLRSVNTKHNEQTFQTCAAEWYRSLNPEQSEVEFALELARLTETEGGLTQALMVAMFG